VLSVVVAFFQSGCVATALTVGQLDGQSPCYHIDVNAPECAWISSADDGEAFLNVAVRKSVRIRDRFTPVQPNNWRCEPNGPVIVRYRLDADADILPVDIVEAWDGTTPSGIATIPVFHRTATSVGEPDKPELLSLALNGPRRGELPREVPSLLVWYEGTHDFANGHGPSCCRLTPFLVRHDGRAVALAATYQSTNFIARTAQIVLLPITLTLDVALMPVYLPVFGVMLLIDPPFI